MNLCRWCGLPTHNSTNICENCAGLVMIVHSNPTLIETLLVWVLTRGASDRTGNIEYASINLKGAANLTRPEG